MNRNKQTDKRKHRSVPNTGKRRSIYIYIYIENKPVTKETDSDHLTE